MQKPKRLCYNRIMLKTKTKVMLSLAVLISAAGFVVSATTNKDATAEACTSSPCNTTFQVNIKETLAVTITPDSTGGTGDIGDFLRNKVTLNVISNNATGFTASMYASNTSLTNAADSSKTIPTLTQTYQRSAFPDNYWGYSLDVNDTSLNNKSYSENDAGNNGSYYHALPTSSAPASVIAQSGAGQITRKLYFGTKTDISQASGTYLGTIVISVVTGSVTPSGPTTPSNPATPNATSEAVYNPAPTGGPNGTTVQTSGTTTVVSDGDNRSAYANAAGVTERNLAENISNGSTIATGIAIAAAVAAAAGTGFLIFAKRRDDDDDEEEEI